MGSSSVADETLELGLSEPSAEMLARDVRLALEMPADCDVMRTLEALSGNSPWGDMKGHRREVFGPLHEAKEPRRDGAVSVIISAADLPVLRAALYDLHEGWSGGRLWRLPSDDERNALKRLAMQLAE